MSEPFNPTALQQLAQLRGMPPEEAALAVAIPEDTVLVLDVHAGEVTDGRIVGWRSAREMTDDESPEALTGDDYLFYLSGASYEETYDPIEEMDRRELVFLQDTPPDQYLVRASGNDPDRARSVASLIAGETGRPAIPLAETDASRAATSALIAGEMYEVERRREAMLEGYRTGRVEALRRERYVEVAVALRVEVGEVVGDAHERGELVGRPGDQDVDEPAALVEQAGFGVLAGGGPRREVERLGG